jgi:hypothetical protein
VCELSVSIYSSFILNFLAVAGKGVSITCSSLPFAHHFLDSFDKFICVFVQGWPEKHVMI